MVKFAVSKRIMGFEFQTCIEYIERGKREATQRLNDIESIQSMLES